LALVDDKIVSSKYGSIASNGKSSKKLKLVSPEN
jgi:hypothetical protein